jgi:hypothetical protein
MPFMMLSLGDAVPEALFGFQLAVGIPAAGDAVLQTVHQRHLRLKLAVGEGFDGEAGERRIAEQTDAVLIGR